MLYEKFFSFWTFLDITYTFIAFSYIAVINLNKYYNNFMFKLILLWYNMNAIKQMEVIQMEKGNVNDFKEWYLNKYLRVNNNYYLIKDKATYLIDEDGDKILLEDGVDMEELMFDGYSIDVDMEKIPEARINGYLNGFLTVGLIEGRHLLPTTEYVFKEIKDPAAVDEIESEARNYWGRWSWNLDGMRVIHTIEVYATGLTVALLATIKAIRGSFPNSQIVIKHYNRDTGEYFDQYL